MTPILEIAADIVQRGEAMRRVAVAALTAVALMGCSKESPTASREAPSAPTKNHFVPDADLPTATKVDIEQLKDRINKLQARVFALEAGAQEHSSAWFDPTGDRSYQRVDSSVGQFLVVLDHVEPYLDGQRVTLLIGNPNNATFAGMKIKASWSRRIPDSTLDEKKLQLAWQEFNSSQKEKEITLTDTLRAGYWNKVRFTVAPAKSDDFGQLGIALTVNSIRLMGGK